jgi:hypothetical protein
MRLWSKVESNSRIQFASNEPKLVPKKLDPGPSFKVGLSLPCPLFPERCQAISGYEISIFHTIVWSNFMTLGTKTQEGMKHQMTGTKISIFHTIVWSKFHDFGDKNPRGDEASNKGYENLNISYHCLIKFHDFGGQNPRGDEASNEGCLYAELYCLAYNCMHPALKPHNEFNCLVLTVGPEIFCATN